MGTQCPDGSGAFFHQQVGSAAQGACRIYEVVDQDDIGTGDVADHRHAGYFVGSFAVFIADDEVAFKVLGVGSGPFNASYVGAGEGDVRQVHFFEKGDKNGFAFEVVDGYVEKTLDLVGVEVHGHNAVGAGSLKEVGDEFGGNGYAGFVFAVLPGVAIVGNNGGDVSCGGSFGGVDQQEEFHEVVGGGKGRLDEKYVAAAHGFVDDGLHFAVAESQYGLVAEGIAIVIGNFIGEVSGLLPAEQFNVHI